MAAKGFDSARFKRDLRDLSRQVKADVRSAMEQGSNLLGDQIRSNAPVDTGALKGSVVVKSVRTRRGRLVQDVQVGGADVRPHAAQVEYGTSREAPNPFIRRSIGTTEPAMVGLIEAALPKS